MTDDGVSVITLNGGSGGAYHVINRSSTNYQGGIQFQDAGASKWYNYLQSGLAGDVLRWFSGSDKLFLANGANILGDANAYVLGVNDSAVTLVYYNGPRGWILSAYPILNYSP